MKKMRVPLLLLNKIANSNGAKALPWMIKVIATSMIVGSKYPDRITSN